MLFLDTMSRGANFERRLDDIVTIACPALGSLVNTAPCNEGVPSWAHGLGTLQRHLHGGRVPAN